MLNDLLLLNKIKNGDVQAFEKLFRSYYKPLCYYADSFLNDMDSAEEIVQNIFYMFWKDRADLQIKLSVKSYLFQAVQNKSYSYLKHLQVMDVYRLMIWNTKNWRANLHLYFNDCLSGREEYSV